VTSFREAQEIALTDFFWTVYDDTNVDEFNFDYSPDEWSTEYIHVFRNSEYYDGVALVPKTAEVTDKEIDYRFFINKKEVDVVASTPEKFEVFDTSTYEDYLAALAQSKYQMFWMVTPEIAPSKLFKFDTYISHHNSYDRKINHAYLNGKFHDGIILCSKDAKFSKREFEYKFIANKKEVNIVISTPSPFDVVFMSYEEPNADENYDKLLQIAPHAKRVHGVKGIHNAHIEAAKLCDTNMLWVVDADALIADDFKFNFQVVKWDQDVVHVWRSQNPINGLVYGYGGVKLLPRKMTVNMDVSKPDMTTSISSKFRPIHEISNITGFNTDPYNTWKSAFRECVKLSSKIIDRQKDEETQKRLQVWCTIGNDRLFGEYAISGAIAGKEYGNEYQNDFDKLKKINDFTWLREKFNATQK
jgi:hypothetical protein